MAREAVDQKSTAIVRKRKRRDAEADTAAATGNSSGKLRCMPDTGNSSGKNGRSSRCKKTTSVLQEKILSKAADLLEAQTLQESLLMLMPLLIEKRMKMRKCRY